MHRVWDAIVVGAGPAGTLVAERLVSRGMKVLLLDAGSRLASGHRAPEVDRRMWPFSVSGPSFDWYRVRAVGGRTLLWGGWSYRFPDVVFRRAGWPYGLNAVRRSYFEIEAQLGVKEGLIDERYQRLGQEAHLSILPKRGSVIRGKPWTSVCSPIGRRARPHAVASRLEHAGDKACALEVFDLRTERLQRLRAKSFVLAASPIETTRILLMSELGAMGKRIGRGLVDHMVASYVLIEPAASPSRRGRGPFPGSALVESFVNRGKGTERDYRGGFSIELAGPVPLEELDIERMAPADELPRTRATVIHAIGEIFPDELRYVDLHPEKRDPLQRPIPHIHVGWTQEDELRAADMKTACRSVADAIAIPGSRLIKFVDPLLPGAGHEAGTCVMGKTEEAPCDPWGRLRALRNVWIADASVMPTAGDRHPTLTLLAHAMRAADSAASYLAGGSSAA